MDQLLLTVQDVRERLDANKNPKRPYPLGSAAWRHAIPSLASWNQTSGSDERIVVERGRPIRFDLERLPPKEKIPGVNFLQSDSDRAHDIVVEAYRGVTVAFSSHGFAVWRGNALFPCSSALPNFAADCVPARERRKVPSGLYVGDQFRTKSICHYTFDYIARAFFSTSLFRLAADDILFPPAVNDYQRYIKAATFPSAGEVRFDTLYEFDTFYLFSDSSSRLDHPAHHCDPRVVEFLRERVLNRRPGTGTAIRNRKLYLSRQDAQKRRPFSNEPEIESALEKLGYTILRMSTLLPENQVSLINEARLVVAPHGAALTSIVFAEMPATLIEIMNPHKGTLAYFKLACSRNLSYRMLIAGRGSDPRSMSVSVDLLTAMVLEAESASPQSLSV